MKNLLIIFLFVGISLHIINATGANKKDSDISFSKSDNSGKLHSFTKDSKFDIGNEVTVCPGTIVNLSADNNGTFYQWSTGSNQQSIDVSDTGIYYVTITYSLDSTSIDSIRIHNFPAMNLTMSTVKATCEASDGSATISVSGSTAPYSYTWCTGDTGVTINDLPAGIYVVSVSDANSCTSLSTANISNINGPNISNVLSSDITCSGFSNGSINITVSGGHLPYTFNWSSGDTTEDINNLQGGPYEIVVTDSAGCQSVESITINEPELLSYSFLTVDATCGNHDGSISLSVYGGVPLYTYLWNNNGTHDTLNNLLSGIYKCTVTDSKGCTLDMPTGIEINNTDGALVEVTGMIPASCGSATGEIDINVTNGNPPYTFLWSNGSTDQNLTNVPPGSYDVTVTDATLCVGFLSVEVSEVLPVEIPICVVSVDSATKRNIIVWIKDTSNPTDHFNIYKETTQADVYQKIASVPYSHLSYYIDPVSNPLIRSWRYKISAEDACGNESSLSLEHKTIHLNINKGIGNSYNLIWDNYEGFTYNSFVVHRYSATTSVILDTLPSNINSYTDFNPIPGTIWYTVAALMDGVSCLSNKAVGGPYNESVSNPEDNAIMDQGVKSTENSYLDMSIFPNPFCDKTTIRFTNNNNSCYNLTITDLTGKVVKEINKINTSSIEINKGGLPTGFYFIEIKGEKIFLGKMIVE